MLSSLVKIRLIALVVRFRFRWSRVNVVTVVSRLTFRLLFSWVLVIRARTFKSASVRTFIFGWVILVSRLTFRVMLRYRLRMAALTLTVRSLNRTIPILLTRA